MKLSLCRMIAVVCIFTMGIMTVTPFIPAVDAHPYVAWFHTHDHHCAEWDGTYHTYCGFRRVTRLNYEMPAGHPGDKNDPNHEQHAQRGKPHVRTSSLERVNNCAECTFT